MPPVVGAIATAALAGTLAATTVTAATLAALGISAAAFGALVAVGTLGVSLLPLAFQQKPRSANFDSFRQEAQGRTLMVRQAVAPRKLIIGGWVRVSGPLTLLEVTNSKRSLHCVFPVTSTSSSGYGAVYLDARPILQSQIGSDGWVTSGPFANKVRIKFHDGADNQEADPDLVAAIPDADETWRGLGISYLYLQIERDRNLFPQIPQLTVYVKGRAVYDPRDVSQSPSIPTTWKWTDNAKLVEAAYLTTPRIRGGQAKANTFAEAWDRIDEDLLIAAANICDEMVAVKPATFDVSVTANQITLSADRSRVAIGQHFTAAGAAFEGYVSNIIDSGLGSQNVVFELASSLAAARAGETLTLPAGDVQITFDQEPRYTANGVIDTKDAPAAILRDLRTAHLGVVYPSGGKWRSYAGAWRPPEGAPLTLADLDGRLKVQTRLPAKQRFNSVKGLFVSPWNDDVMSDYPAVESQALIADDNGNQTWAEFNQPWQNSPTAAQRIATVFLQRSRLERRVEAPFKWTAFRLRAVDNVALEVPHRGWNPLLFEVTRWQPALRPSKSGDGPPYFGIDMELQENDAGVWTYDETGQTIAVPVRASNLPDAFNVEPPTEVTLDSGTAALFVKKDGTVVSRIRGLITPSADATVDTYRVRYKRSDEPDTAYRAIEPVANDGTLDFTIWEVAEGESYDVETVAVNYLGQTSDPVIIAGHVVAGKSALPSDVVGLQAQQNGNVVVVRLQEVGDLDLAGYEFRIVERSSA